MANNAIPAKQQYNEFQTDLNWALLLFTVNVVFQSIYAIEVCPYVENLTNLEVFTANGLIAIIAVTIRRTWYKQLFKKGITASCSRRLIFYDALIILSGGILWGIYNMIMHEFPPESGLKVLTGFISTGVLTGLLLFVIRKVSLLKNNQESSSEKTNTASYSPLSKDLLILAIVIIILVMMNGIFIVVKDLKWIITLQEDQFMWATKSVISEIVFVALAYSFYIVLISLFYSAYLRLQLKNQTSVLDAVSNGILTENAKSIGNDEFGIVAQYTNKMIHQLRAHSEIAKSIEYTRNLQEALLPNSRLMEQYFPDHFVLFKPRDIVSGDFYWTEKIGNNTFIAAADSTGHGVPGAMVSIICINALNRAIKEYQLMDPADILFKTRELVVESFQCGEASIRDGMDISLCIINASTQTIIWAGAYNPLWILSSTKINSADRYLEGNQHTLSMFNGDRQAVGFCENKLPFTSRQIKFKSGDQIFLFSDGYADQFGGDKGKKFKSKNLKQLILSNGHLSRQAQKSNLEKTLINWQGEHEQVDDICLLGIKL